MELTITHRNSLGLAIDEKMVHASEAVLQRKIKEALIEMIQENIIDPGDSFTIDET